MSDTQQQQQKPQSLAELATAALTGVLDKGMPCLEEWAKQNPHQDQYFCNAEGCAGHSLKGSRLEFLHNSRLFSYHVNGNGFSAANAGSINVDGIEIPLAVFWKAAVTIIPVCEGSSLPIVRDFTAGGKTRVQFTTRMQESESEGEGESSDKTGRGRGRSRRRVNNA